MKVTSTAVKKTVAAAATPEQLASETTLCISCVIQALSSNTGDVFVGSTSNLTDHAGANPGIRLEAGDTYTLADFTKTGNDLAIDLADFYLKVGSDGEGVVIHHFKIDR